jgi:hypothetical protein
MLRRCQSVLLMLLLAVSSPVGWLGERANSHAKCDGTCCPKRPRAETAQGAKPSAPGETAFCLRGTAAHWSICLTKSSQAGEFGVVAPLRPATLLQEDAMPELQALHFVAVTQADSPCSGFMRPPFQPPRSS